MSMWYERLEWEKNELDERREKLMKFKDSVQFDLLLAEDQELLNTQGHLMTALSAVLGARLERAKRAGV